MEILIKVLITTLVFTGFGYAMALVGTRKKNRRCSLCGLKPEDKGMYITCGKAEN